MTQLRPWPFLLVCLSGVGASNAQTPAPASSPAAAPAPRPVPPTRDPHTPGYVTATELPDGAIPPVDVDGNFIVGPTHKAAPETVVMHGMRWLIAARRIAFSSKKDSRPSGVLMIKSTFPLLM